MKEVVNDLVVKKVKDFYSASILQCEIIDPCNNNVMFIYGLVELSDNELDLDAGRFKRYNKTITSNGIQFQVKAFAMFRAMTNVIDWLGENSKDHWAFHLLCGERGYDITVTIFFENLEDAVLFRLSLNVQ